MRFLFLVAPLLLGGVCNSMVVAPPSSPLPTTIPDVLVRVCTGADCRVDGASECLRMMQKLASTTSNNSTDKTLLKVKASPCLGPCGDGPNVVVMDGTTNKRIVDTELQARRNGSGSVVPADIFGASVTGVYQVRSSQDAAGVINLAIGSLTKSLDNDDQNVAQSASSKLAALESNDSNTVVVITSNRAWYDRPRNERLMLQRLMHVSILAGLASYGTSSQGCGELSNLQWGTAAILWIASNFIMKESLLEMVLLKTKKQLRIM
jgi:Thioredoxin-like [2Fe-2S] ferredoxin